MHNISNITHILSTISYCYKDVTMEFDTVSLAPIKANVIPITYNGTSVSYVKPGDIRYEARPPLYRLQ